MRLASTTATTKATALAMSMASILILLLSSSTTTTVEAQASGAGANIPPLSTDRVHLAYWNNANEELAAEFALYNTCFVTDSASRPAYAYLTMVPKNATINFYKDTGCGGGAFAFAMDGYYLGYPGEARSFRWVGWSEDAIGEIQTTAPIPLMAGSPNPNTPGTPQPALPPSKQDPPSTQQPPVTGGQEPELEPGHGHAGGAKAGDDEKSYSATFFGGVIGTLTVLSIGGVAFWRKVGRKMIEEDDKGKDVLPYNRVAGGGRDVSRRNVVEEEEEEVGEGDQDILLATNNRMSHNSFALEEEDGEDEEEDEGQGRDEGDSVVDDREVNNGLLSPSGSRHL